MFGAVRNHGDIHAVGDGSVTFDESVINIGNGMDIQSGNFSAPIPGYYYFSFSGTAYDPDSYLDVVVCIHKNGEILYTIQDFNGSKGDGQNHNTNNNIQYRNLAHTWITKLQKNDIIHLDVLYGSLSTGYDKMVTFTGELILKSE